MLTSLTSWINGQALATWGSRGVDNRTGLFHERLSLAGEPLPVPYRAMVQARQIYVFAHAATLGLAPGAAEKADRAMNRLRALFATSDGDETSFAFSIDPASGRHHATHRDAYTHAFVLLAVAYLYRATQDPALITLAGDVARFLERRLIDPVAGGVLDALPEPDGGAKRQNPQMHLLEAYLALEDAMPGHGYLERAPDLVTLFRRQLFDQGSGVLLEHFAADWGPHPDPARASVFEPGHHYEWVWLLEQVERLSGEPLAREREQLWTAARQAGHAADGLIFDEVDASRAVISPSARLWPHTEAIKAATTMHRAGDPGARAFADAMAAALLDTFLRGPFEGGWIDHVGQDRTPRVSYVPASSLYHLFLAGAEGHAAFGGDTTTR
jgi:mannose/cellobiose epimerase-like protein (N-acyl-D-glucosamine 2-epimerase family)